MTRLLTICLVSWAIFDIGESVSTKLEFDEEKESSGQVSNSSKEDEDVEVKHTIVVSTKLKNNNRRGLHNDRDNTATFSVGRPLSTKTDDSGEVPIIKGYKSVESTLIRTPDTRAKAPVFTNPVYISRNIPYEYNSYPVASNPTQWKPSSFFNNVNWWNEENAGSFNNFNRGDWQGHGNQAKYHRKMTEDGVKEFYCRKCRELSNGSEVKCLQQRSNSWFYESTTQKIKIDGKLAKLN